MKKPWQYLLGGGVCAGVFVIFLIAVRQSPDSGKNIVVPIQKTPEPVREPASGYTPGTAVLPVDSGTSSPVASEQIAVIPANATSIPDASLYRLSMMVNLAEARDHRPDKAQWEQAVVIAGKLLEGPCDCEQKNWLKHFVEMGNYALSNSDEYYKSAQLMATLPRNDNEAMALSHKAD